MSELTLHTGLMGNEHIINIDWSDHNNVRFKDVIEVKILNQDKPRVLTIDINEETVYRSDSSTPQKNRIYKFSHESKVDFLTIPESLTTGCIEQDYFLLKKFLKLKYGDVNISAIEYLGIG